jgi:CBS domain-containing protein
VITLLETASLVDAAVTMRDAGIGAVVVLEGETVCGIATDRIVVRGIADGRDPRSTSQGDVCSRDLATLSPDDQFGTAVRLMRERAIRRLPVVEAGRPVGILTIGDLAVQEAPGQGWPPPPLALWTRNLSVFSSDASSMKGACRMLGNVATLC